MTTEEKRRRKILVDAKNSVNLAEYRLEILIKDFKDQGEWVYTGLEEALELIRKAKLKLPI